MKYTITLAYQGKQYVFEDEYDYQGCDADHNTDWQVTYMYTEGNYVCDCNLSRFIGEYCDEDFPEMGCGEDIALVAIREGERVVWPEPMYTQNKQGIYLLETHQE